MRKTDDRIAMVDAVCDVETSEKPFGRRWHQDEITLRPEHLAALVEGRILALDVLEEYVVFVKLDQETNSTLKELGYGG